ncbi:MAG: PorT family protein, partial [Bacteroidaceae bacterium]|nr:PorT family protein [Bacteroidaceae bacterium]
MKKILLLLCFVILALPVMSQMERVQYRPYIDQRRYHYGFMVGLHTQDYEFVNNGFITPSGE